MAVVDFWIGRPGQLLGLASNRLLYNNNKNKVRKKSYIHSYSQYVFIN